MDKLNNNATTTITTDLLYENLADPSKLLPLKQTAKIVNNDNASENEGSFMLELNNDAKKTSLKMDFNSDKEKSRSHQTVEKSVEKSVVKSVVKSVEKSVGKSIKKSSSRLASRDRSVSKSVHATELRQAINNNLKMNMDKFTSEENKNDSKPPTVNPVFPPQPDLQEQRKQAVNNVVENVVDNAIDNAVDNAVDNIATAKELKFKKMECLAKLMHIKNMGIELTRKDYNMNSDLEDLQAELKYQSDIQSKKDGIQLCKSIMCNAITGIEFLNERYDPFGFKLKGWSDQVKMNKDDFDSVFAELLEKYKGKGSKMEPELKLAMMLVFSGASFHASQVINTGLPMIDDVIKNNPQLMSKVQSGINKTISGPTEFEKKKEIYESVKKIHNDKLRQVNKQVNHTNLADKTQKPEQKVNTKPMTVKNLLQNIKKTIPLDSANNSITIGDTIDNEDHSSENKTSVSKNVKTKSRLAGRNKVQLVND